MSKEVRPETDEEKRFEWIKTLEEKYTYEKEGAIRPPPLSALQLYDDATNAFRYGSYFGCIAIIGSAIEAVLVEETSSERFDPKKTLTNYAEMACKDELISKTLGKDISNFSKFIRNHVVHPKGTGGLQMLGFKAIRRTKEVSLGKRQEYKIYRQGWQIVFRWVRFPKTLQNWESNCILKR